MELAILHPSFGAVGGAEVLAVAQAHALRKAGVDARIVTSAVDAARWEEAFEGIPVSRYRHRAVSEVFVWGKVARLRLRARRAQSRLAGADVVIAYNHPCNALLGAMRVDALKLWQVNEPTRLLYLPDTHPVLAARARALGTAAPDWLTRHFAERLVRWERRMADDRSLRGRRTFDAAMTAALDGAYAISEYSRAMARRIYGRCSDTLVYPMVDELSYSAPSRRGIRCTALQVLAQSRLEPEKNIETVIRGFSSLAHRRAGARLHIVGEGSDRGRLEALAARLAPGAICFHGFLDRRALADVRSACDVFALLPLDEPFGLVFTEAMASGLLCIGPDHGGPHEIMDGGTFGWPVDAFAPEALTEALDAILALRHDEADRRRTAACTSVSARFSAAAMVGSLRTVLHEHGLDWRQSSTSSSSAPLR